MNKKFWNILKDIIIHSLPIFISLMALFTSFKACDLSQDSNRISKEANELAEKSIADSSSKANEANRIAKESNGIAEKSLLLAQDANKIAKESAAQAIDANKISLESNRISQKANELTEKAISESSAKADEANRVAKNSNEIAEKSLFQSEKTSLESLKYIEINAQIMWNNLKESYDNADREVLEWEKNNNFSRANQPVDTLEDLIDYVNQLNISEEGKMLYRNRFDKRMSLINASEAYEPFKERLSNLDFTLPKAPLLPKYLIDSEGKMILDESGRPILVR